MKKRFNHLSWTKRLQLEALLKAKTSVREIAQTLGVHISTIYREMKRGRYEHLVGSTWEIEDRYSPDIAHDKYRAHLAAKGAPLKIVNDDAFCAYLEKRTTSSRFYLC